MQRSPETIREYPAFPVAVAFIKTRYMIDESQAAEFRAYCFQCALGEIVFLG